MKQIREEQRLSHTGSRSFTSSFGFVYSTTAEPYRPSRSGTASPVLPHPSRPSTNPSLSAPSTPIPYSSSPRKSSLSNSHNFEGGPNTNGTINTSLYKTELCRSFVETGTCRYGNKCQFAHGEKELRPVYRHPRYKTEICQTFAQTGTCKYGSRCRFIHALPGEISPQDNDDTNNNNNNNNFNNNSQNQLFMDFNQFNQMNQVNQIQQEYQINDDNEDDDNENRLPVFQNLSQN